MNATAASTRGTAAPRLEQQRTRGAARVKGRPRNARPGNEKPARGRRHPGRRLPAPRAAPLAAKPAGSPLPRLPSALEVPHVSAGSGRVHSPLRHLGLAHCGPCGGGRRNACTPHPPPAAHPAVALGCGAGRCRNGIPEHRRLGAQPLRPTTLAGPWPRGWSVQRGPARKRHLVLP